MLVSEMVSEVVCEEGERHTEEEGKGREGGQVSGRTVEVGGGDRKGV